MKNSVLRRQYLLILIAAVLTSAILIVAIYAITSHRVLRNLGAQEFRNKSAYLAEQTGRYVGQEISALRFNDILSTTAEMTDASITVFLFNAPTEYYGKTSANTGFDEHFLTAARSEMTKHQDRIKAGMSIDFTLQYGEDHQQILVVGYPIIVQDQYSETNVIVGSVFVMKSLQDMNSGSRSLYLPLILACAITFLLMFTPVLFLANRITQPVNQMKDIAQAMSNGNFTLRADSGQPGEIGELARALNQLAADLKRTVSALLTERNRLRQILNGLNEGIAAFDGDFRLTHCNPAFFQLLNLDSDSDHPLEDTDHDIFTGLSRAEGLNDASKKIISLLPAGIKEDFQKALSDGLQRRRTIRLENSLIYVQIEVLKDTEDQVVGAVGLFRDVTEAEKLEQTRRDYIANISHELRTPLTAMRALIEPMQDGMVKDDAALHRYYDIIHAECIRLSRLIDDMMELSRIQAGQIPLEKMNFKIEDILKKLRENYALMCRERQIDLVFTMVQENYKPLFSNPDRIEQILVILLDNAIKFTPTGGRIEVATNEQDSALVITVKDNGEGIAAADLPHVFERFYKADKARGKSGTGLGLSIAAELTRLLGGHLAVKSKPGEGAKFTLTLPF